MTLAVLTLHLEQPELARILAPYDITVLADRLARFIVSRTGGPPVYNGPPLTESHGHLNLTNEIFVLGGGDVPVAMKELGYDEGVTNDVVCMLASLRDQVVLSGAAE